jgi:hypothetical protein
MQVWDFRVSPLAQAKCSRFFVITEITRDNTPSKADIHEIYRDPLCNMNMALRDLVTVTDEKLLQVKVNGDGSRSLRSVDDYLFATREPI